MSDHALFSPSGAHRWMRCPGSLVLESAEPNSSSAYADEGTAAHDLAARVLTAKLPARGFIGVEIAAGERSFTVDAAMADAVQSYADSVNLQVALDNAALLVEQRVAFGDEIGVPDADAFGTSDVIALGADGVLTVADLKYGMGVRVDAEDNEQLQLYALGALRVAELLGYVTRVRMVIVMPRLDHISVWEQDVRDLRSFADGAANAAVQVLEAFLAADVTPFLVPGEKQCRFCKAKATCPAVRAQVEEATTLAASDLPRVFGDRLGSAMDMVETVESWARAVRARVEAELFSGREVAGWKLVEGKRGSRKWGDGDEAEKRLKAMRLRVEQMYDMKLISPTTAEKLLAKESPRRWAALQELIVQEPGKPSVAPAADRRAPLALASDVSAFPDMAADPAASAWAR